MDLLRIPRRAAAAVALAGLCACAGSTQTTGPTASLTLNPSVSSIRNDGTKATILATAVTASGTPGAGNVTFATAYGSLTDPVTNATVTSATLAADGTARVDYSCNISADSRCVAGGVFVNAAWTSTGKTVSLTLTAPPGTGGTPPPPPPGGGTPPPSGNPPGAPATIIATDATPFVLGVKGSGIQEQGTITFKVTDAIGVPVPNVGVTFTVKAPQLGVALMRTTANTDANGLVQAAYTSGPEVGVTAITATITAASTSRAVAVRGARPSANGLYFRCQHASLPVYTTIGEYETMVCTVRLTDRQGNRVGIPTVVSFATEAGAIAASVTTKAFDPTRPDDAAEGTATVTFSSNMGNGNAPADVAPLAPTVGQYPWDLTVAEPSRVDGLLTLNPRDQLVTLIAMTRGEEAFEDANHNGLWDVGEVFVDEGDAYVDANDNGSYDSTLAGGVAEHRFCGLNADCSIYRGPNAQWDADTIIWRPTWVVFAGVGSPSTAAAGQPPPPQPPPPALPSDFSLRCADYKDAAVAGHASLISANIYVYDYWLNTPAAGFTTSVGTASSDKLTALGLGLAGPALETWGAMGVLGFGFDWVRVAATDNTKACAIANGPACVEKLAFRFFDDGFAGVVTVKNTTTIPTSPVSTTGVGCAREPAGAGPAPDQFGSTTFLVPVTVNNANAVISTRQYGGLFAPGTG